MSELTLSDIDFYERKIKSVEQDNIYLHDEIMKLRGRLRVAEDYQIKYSLLIANTQRETQKMRTQIERQQEQKHQQIWMNKLKANDEKWSTQLHQLQNRLRGQAKIQIQDLKKELSAKTQQLITLKEKAEQIELFGFKMSKIEKENHALRQQLQEMRQFYQKQRTEEISKIRTTLSNTYRQKIDKQQNRYQQQIADLQNKLNRLQIQEDTSQFKASDATNRELLSVKALFQQKKAQYAQQVQALTRQLTNKNEQISKALHQNYELDLKYRSLLKEKNDYINNLEQKILEREKQHEIELLNLIQRQNAAKSSVNAELMAQNQRLNEEILKFNELWNEKIMNHENEIEQLNNKFDQQRRKIIQEKNMHKRKISELSSKMKEAQGERQSGDTQMLINSLRDMDMKEDQITSYQNGITFLQRQYKKCQIKLQQKSRTLSKLYKDINEIRNEADKQLNELKEKMKKEKKQNLDKIIHLERQLRDAEDKLRHKEKQQRKRAKQLEKDKLLLEEQNKSLKELNEELQRDYNRLVEGKKGIQASFRQEREKSFSSRSDLNIVKKQKWLQLEKQKNQLQIIFKEKQEQLKLQFEQELDNKVAQINKLKQDFQITQQQNELLKKQNERLHQQQEENKENSKMAEYNKKMASLNLQIALTQNLYQSLIQAKSRISIPSYQQIGSDFKIDIVDSHEQLHMSFHPSAKSKF